MAKDNERKTQLNLLDRIADALEEMSPNPRVCWVTLTATTEDDTTTWTSDKYYAELEDAVASGAFVVAKFLDSYILYAPIFGIDGENKTVAFQVHSVNTTDGKLGIFHFVVGEDSVTETYYTVTLDADDADPDDNG